LSHHLGHIFGLNDVDSDLDLSPLNLMWNDPLDPVGLDARVELTLGQVFLMNLHPTSWLNRSILSGRLGDPTVNCTPTQPCPEVSAGSVTGGGNP
jgi:hypothetical protein